jgi:putative intracellular protease/amidase
MKKPFLFVTTSHHEMAGHPTGVWLEEYAVPFVALRAAGHAIVVASPRGGPMPIDPRSAANAGQAADWHEAIAAAESSRPLAGLEAAEFAAVFLPGGHGPMFDLPDDPDLQRLLTAFHSAGKIIGAVCHGPAGLVNARRADGSYLVSGQRLTAYTWAEEVQAKLDQTVPFILENVLRERGAFFENAAPRQEHVVRDGRLVTGQNPFSSAAVAEAFAAALAETTGA